MAEPINLEKLSKKTPKEVALKPKATKKKKTPQKKWTLKLIKLVGALLSGFLVFYLYQYVIVINPSPQPDNPETFSHLSDDLKGNLALTSSSSSIPSSSNENTTTPTSDIDIPSDLLAQRLFFGDMEVDDIKNIPTITRSQETIGNFRLGSQSIIAGNPLEISAKISEDTSSITFWIGNDDTDQVRAISASPNSDGIVVATLSGLKNTGTYFVAAGSNERIIGTGKLYFNVLPSDTSLKNSNIIIDKITLKTNEETEITVTINDEFDNPIPNHLIEIKSNNKNTIKNIQPKTNENGTAYFLFKNTEDLDSTLYIIDKNSGIVFPNIKTKHLEPETKKDIISFFIPTARASFFDSRSVKAAGEANRLEIKELKATTTPNRSETFKVRILDETDALVKDFGGTVTFTSTDTDAELPSDYTFKLSDQGEKLFLAGLQFHTPGKQTITVQYTDDVTVSGSYRVTVQGSTNTNTGSSDIEILSPMDGSTLNQNTINIAGSAPSNSTVVLFDNDIVKLGTTTAGSDGSFFFQTKSLTSGTHNFVAKANDVSSAKIQVIIDNNSPEIDKIKITPGTTIEANTPMTVEVQSEKGLGIKIFINKIGIKLLESTPGIYQATFKSPPTPGVYSVDVEISDNISNSDIFDSVAQFTVIQINSNTTSSSSTTTNTSSSSPTGVDPSPSEVISGGNDSSQPGGEEIPENNESGPEHIILISLTLALAIGVYSEYKKS